MQRDSEKDPTGYPNALLARLLIGQVCFVHFTVFFYESFFFNVNDSKLQLEHKLFIRY